MHVYGYGNGNHLARVFTGCVWTAQYTFILCTHMATRTKTGYKNKYTFFRSTPRSVCVPWYQYQYKKNKTCINFYSVRPMKCCVHVLHVSQPSMFNTLETFPSPPTFYGLLFPQYEHVVQLPHLNGLHHHWFHPL